VPAAGGAVEAVPLAADAETAAALGIAGGPLTAAQLRQVLLGAAGGAAGGGILAQLSAAPGPGERHGLLLQLAALGRVLLPPRVREATARASEIVVLPHDSLHMLPLETLVVDLQPSEGRPRFLLEAAGPIRYAPSATALRMIADRPLPPGEPSRLVLSLFDPVIALSTGAPENGAVPPAGVEAAVGPVPSLLLGPLPGTAVEAAAVARAFASPGGPPLLSLRQREATEARLRDGMRGARFIHLATHALAGAAGSELFSGLVLSPPTSGAVQPEDDGFLQLHEIYTLSLQADLAVLSACRTHYGPHVRGEGVFGLARGFLAAGSRRVVASQWSVDDAATALLVGGLFDRIAAAERAGEASPAYAGSLRAAKLGLLSRPQLRDPFYWAAFVLAGVE
jgi:CHAT domain-containing protein